jgi:hypothetical protein
MIRTIDDNAPEIPDDLELATAPVRSAGVAYQLGDEQWIVVARHAAEEPIKIYGDKVYAFLEPMITYCTDLPNILATGCRNLLDSPRLATCVLRHRLKIFHNSVRYHEALAGIYAK